MEGSDLQAVAAYAGSSSFSPPGRKHQPRQDRHNHNGPGRGRGRGRHNRKPYMNAAVHRGSEDRGSGWGYEEGADQLPSVDDLEVAAAAATAAWGDSQVPSFISGKPAASAVPHRPTGAETSSSSSSSSSSDEHSGQEDEGASERDIAVEGVEDEEMWEFDDDAAGPFVAKLEVQGEAVRLHLEPRMEWGVPREAAVAGSSSSSSSSSESDVMEIEEMRAAVAKMCEEDDEPATAPVPNDVALGLPQLEALDVQVGEGDTLLPAGTISAVLEGMIVVQSRELGQALDEGTLICLEDRTVLGRVEEVFGRVNAPLYALRYAGATPMPASVAPPARVFSVEQYTEYIQPDTLRAPAVDASPEEEDTPAFSDDEQEEAYLRQAQAKRKEAPEQQHGQGRFDARRQAPGRGNRGGGRGGGRGAAATSTCQVHATASHMASALSLDPRSGGPGSPRHISQRLSAPQHSQSRHNGTSMGPARPPPASMPAPVQFHQQQQFPGGYQPPAPQQSAPMPQGVWISDGKGGLQFAGPLAGAPQQMPAPMQMAGMQAAPQGMQPSMMQYPGQFSGGHLGQFQQPLQQGLVRGPAPPPGHPLQQQQLGAGLQGVVRGPAPPPGQPPTTPASAGQGAVQYHRGL